MSSHIKSLLVLGLVMALLALPRAIVQAGSYEQAASSYRTALLPCPPNVSVESCRMAGYNNQFSSTEVCIGPASWVIQTAPAGYTEIWTATAWTDTTRVTAARSGDFFNRLNSTQNYFDVTYNTNPTAVIWPCWFGENNAMSWGIEIQNGATWRVIPTGLYGALTFRDLGGKWYGWYFTQGVFSMPTTWTVNGTMP